MPNEGGNCACPLSPISVSWLSWEPSFLPLCRLTCWPIFEAWALLWTVSRLRVFSLPVSPAPPPPEQPVQLRPCLCPWQPHRPFYRWLGLPRFPKLARWLPPPRLLPRDPASAVAAAAVVAAQTASETSRSQCASAAC